MRIVSQGSCPSPKCNSSDAFTLYEDGHGWCFSCHYYKPAKITSIKQATNILSPKSQDNYLAFPVDFSHEIPKEPLTWLKKYGLTNDEIEKNKWGWSESKEMLIIPFFADAETLVGWQGRYFPARTPKVNTKGNVLDHLVIFLSDVSSDAITAVEDCVSAIKVSRYCDSIALLGSNIDAGRAVRLSKMYTTLNIWLDSDKIKDAHKYAQRYKSLFKKVNVIYTELDPKENNDQDIRKIIKDLYGDVDD